MGDAVSAGPVRLSVAGLQLALNPQDPGLLLAAPRIYRPFLGGAPQDGLMLTVRAGALDDKAAWRPVFVATDMWDLWRSEAGDYLFGVAEAFCSPARQVILDAGFRTGEVRGPFAAGESPAGAIFPLDCIDVVLFVNWLAETGDLLLHASGVILDGRGYAFAGISGAGKSTLAATLARGSGVTVLGEDSVALRWLDGGYRIYGTPWHTDPARCGAADAPLAKLFFLDRTAPAGVEPCSPVEGIQLIFQTAFIPTYRHDAMDRILGNLERLAGCVPFYKLSYRFGEDPLPLILRA